MVVQAGFMRDGFAEVFRGAGELERLRTVEGRRISDLASFFAVDLWSCVKKEGFNKKGLLRDRKRTPLDTALAAALALRLCLPPMGAGGGNYQRHF